jgi:hypothetical protein
MMQHNPPQKNDVFMILILEYLAEQIYLTLKNDVSFGLLL